MPKTVHRRDMQGADFKLLAFLSWIIQQYCLDGSQLNFGPIYALGEIELLLPVWESVGKNDWQLSTYKPFVREALGVKTSTLRRICHYLRVSESVLTGTLFRFSMLSVIPGQLKDYPPKFKMEFWGEILGREGFAEQERDVGFIVERRRLEGNFKSGGA